MYKRLDRPDAIKILYLSDYGKIHIPRAAVPILEKYVNNCIDIHQAGRDILQLIKEYKTAFDEMDI